MATYGSVTNFNALETSSNVTVGGELITPSIALTGDFKLIDVVESKSGTTDLATTADLDNVSYQAVSSTSGALKKYLLETPVAGARKTILVNTAGLGDVYIYASASSAVTAYFGGNTSQNIMKCTTCNLITIDLLGISTAKWAVTGVSTLNNLTTGTLVLISSNS